MEFDQMVNKHEVPNSDCGNQEPQQLTRAAPVLNLIWFDEGELASIKSSSRFSDLRSQLNSGTVTINLGILKYQVGGANSGEDNRDVRQIAKDIFLGTKVTTVSEFHDLLRRKVQQAKEDFWKPELVVIDGHLNIPLHRRYMLDSLLRRICRHLGYHTDGTPDGPATEAQYHKAMDVLTRLANDFFGEDNVKRALQGEFDPSKHEACRIVHSGESLIQGVVTAADGKGADQIRFHVALPEEVLRHLPYPSGMDGRILGWLEHAKEALFYVRAIALARIDVLGVVGQEAQDL